MGKLMEKVEKSVLFIRGIIGDFTPDVAIILGTGLSRIGEDVLNQKIIPYKNIPYFPLSTVEGHRGNLVFGEISGKRVVVMQGRVHYYEGYSMQDVTYPVRVMKILGIKTVIISNAAGGLNQTFSQGDIMFITDHINLMGDNPLRGPNEDEFGPRFPEMHDAYSKRLLSFARDVAQKKGIFAREGVYVGLFGPSLETRAEYRFLSLIGADAIGQSTIPEVIVARHMGVEVLGISVITNISAWGIVSPTTIEEIIKVSLDTGPLVYKIIDGVIKKL